MILYARWRGSFGLITAGSLLSFIVDVGLFILIADGRLRLLLVCGDMSFVVDDVFLLRIVERGLTGSMFLLVVSRSSCCLLLMRV